MTSQWRYPRKDPVPEDLKRCTRCEIDYKPSEFHTNAGRRNGLDSWCKSCVRLRTRRYAQLRRSHERDDSVAGVPGIATED